MAEKGDDPKLLFEGDFIVAQTEVIFFKKKKKKSKQKQQRCILLITREQVALTNPSTNKAVVMFPRNTIVDYRSNVDGDIYKLQLSVQIGHKVHQLCIEFPTEDAQIQRDKFLEHFKEDKDKPMDNTPQPPNQQNGNKHQREKPQINGNTHQSTTNGNNHKHQNGNNHHQTSNQNGNRSSNGTSFCILYHFSYILVTKIKNQSLHQMPCNYPLNDKSDRDEVKKESMKEWMRKH